MEKKNVLPLIFQKNVFEKTLQDHPGNHKNNSIFHDISLLSNENIEHNFANKNKYKQHDAYGSVS